MSSRGVTHRLGCVAAQVALAALTLTLASARADTSVAESDVTAPKPAPARYLRTLAHDPAGYDPSRTLVATDLLLGDLLFHSPRVLGEKARKLGLSCDSCHSNGAANTTLALGDLSDKPGNIDLSTAHFRAGADDHVKSFVNIPSLRGARFTGPYGHDGRTASLTEFSSSVITSEFGGAPLSGAKLAALVRYVQDLDFLPNANLDAHGKITARAGAAAKHGEALFELPRAGFSGQSCATCHSASTFFRDGKTHRIGSTTKPSAHAIDDGEETPTLLGTAETAPYFHDGRFATIADVITFFDSSFALGLSARDRADLAEYVKAVGAVDTPADDRPLARRLVEGFVYVELLVAGDSAQDRDVWTMALEAANRTLIGAPDVPALHDRVHADLAAISSLIARANGGAALPPMQKEVKDLSRELARLAADIAGALPAN